MSEIQISKDMQQSLAEPEAVQELLSSLRGRLRLYAALSGVLLTVTCLSCAFWFTTGLDSGWFAIQKLELPVGLRAILLAIMLAGTALLIGVSILRPLVQHIGDLDLALLLEQHCPDFQDRLVTTIESRESEGIASELQQSMLRRTVAQAGQLAATVESESLFDLRVLRTQGLNAGFLLFSVAGIAACYPGMLSQWWDAFIKCEETYRVRTTQLDVSVIAQPGDRKMEFASVNDRQVYLHPRGNDLELEMIVPEGDSPVGEPWVVPERVRVDVLRQDGSRSRTYVSSTSDRTFRFILSRLQESVEIELMAGDYRTTTPLAIESVSPPGIDGISVTCEFPDYTGWNVQRETRFDVHGSEISLPYGTRFELRAFSSKPLQSARIVTDAFELSGDKESCALIPREGYTSQLGDISSLVSSDGMSIQSSFVVLDVSEESDDPKDDVSELSVPSNLSLRFFLHDEDGIISMNPESIRIRGIPDEAPVITTSIVGVENAITRRATIPVTGVIRDDYGLTQAGFEFVVDDATEWRPRPFHNAGWMGSTEFHLGQAGSRGETFDVQPLDLTEGQTLALSVVALDNSEIGQQNDTRGDPVLFRIVSNEELLSLLYTREINLRRRFEEVIRQLEQLNEDLNFHKELADRVESNLEPQTRQEDLASLTTSANRSGDSLRRQNNELVSIIEGFDGVIDQLINNQIPPSQLADNMRQDIVVPLEQIVSQQLPEADKKISQFRVLAIDGRPTEESVAEAERAVTAVISRLKTILDSVRDMAEFHEALRDLKAILEEQQRILDKTKQEKLKGFFDDL